MPSPTATLKSVTTTQLPVTRTEEPLSSSQPPESIVDTIDSDICNLIHNIEACFTDGQPPEHIPVGEYLAVFILSRDDLAQRFGLNPELVKIQMIERAEWSDTSLGNPQPGEKYSQIVVPGFNMMLEIEGSVYVYHTSLERVVFVERR